MIQLTVIDLVDWSSSLQVSIEEKSRHESEEACVT